MYICTYVFVYDYTKSIIKIKENFYPTFFTICCNIINLSNHLTYPE